MTAAPPMLARCATTPPRLPDWQLRWDALRTERAATPFAWGQHDCCLWAADAVRAITGQDLAAPWRGHYRSATQAMRLLAAHGGVRGLACAALGDAVAPCWATVGDIVVIDAAFAGGPEGLQELLAVCNGASALAAGPQGLQALGMSAAVAVWKV